MTIYLIMTTWNYRIVSMLGVILIIVLWITLPSNQSPIPPLLNIIAKGWVLIQTGELMKDIQASLYRVSIGLFFGILHGIIVGVLCIFSLFRFMITPLIELTRPIPPIAWIPLMLVIFGIGNVSAIALVALASFFPIIVAVIHSIDGIDNDLVLMAKSHGAQIGSLIRYVYMPSVLPTFLTGVRLGTGLGWFSVVAAEMMGRLYSI